MGKYLFLWHMSTTRYIQRKFVFSNIPSCISWSQYYNQEQNGIWCVNEDWLGKELIAKRYISSWIFLWSDSMVALVFLFFSISTYSLRWKQFVTNRINEIKNSNLSAQWNQIKSEDNPANFISKYILPSILIKETLWQSGLPWLSISSENWPLNTKGPTPKEFEDVPEERTIKIESFVTSNI